MPTYNRREMLFEGREICKSANLVCSPLGDELLIYDSASGCVHVLNKTAHQVWKWLDQGMGAAEMVNRFCDSYAGATPEIANRDVLQILRVFFESAIIITRVKSPAQAIRVAG